MAEYEETIELYQALNAVQIAEAQAAGKYAPEVMAKARQQYEEARQLQIGKAGRSAIVTAARQAAQTAEDARALATTRKHDMELASARGDVDREQQLRLKAEAYCGRAQAKRCGGDECAGNGDEIRTGNWRSRRRRLQHPRLRRLHLRGHR